MLSAVDGEHEEEASEEQDPGLVATRPDTGRQPSSEDGDDDDDGDEEDDVVIPAGRNTGLSLLLGIVGMILIPVGLIVIFLAITRGERLQDQNQNTLTAQTVVPGAFAPPLSALTGRWAVVGGSDSWVGYAVGEKFLTVETPSSAEGRTTSVDGGFFLANGTLTGVAINAHLDDLKSDDAKRDETLRTRGLDTDHFPGATFSLADPVPLVRVPPIGEHVDVVVKGDLTLHGVTKSIELKLQVQVLAGEPTVLEVVANQPILFADFGIEPPTIAGLVSVQDRGELSIHLRFARVPDEVGAVPPRGTAVPGTVPEAAVPGVLPGTPTPGSVPGSTVP
jgi:polyisoprenoid-binding protein YceI